MTGQTIHERLYLANATVLLAHQVDAAYWHEWTMFALPGGIQLFVVLNLPIVLLVLVGGRALALGHRHGRALSWALAAAGGFAAVFHSVHLLQGHDAFVLPASLALLGATAILSAAQAWALLRAAPSPGGAPVAPAEP